MKVLVEVVLSSAAVALPVLWPLLTPSGKEWRDNLKQPR